MCIRDSPYREPSPLYRKLSPPYRQLSPPYRQLSPPYGHLLPPVVALRSCIVIITWARAPLPSALPPPTAEACRLSPIRPTEAF
eukprot:721283-Prorocentrum_minimum.AAC.1